MKKAKRLLALLLALTMVVCLCACQKRDKEDDEKDVKLTPAEVIEKSAAAQEEINSVEMGMDIKLEMTGEGEKLKVNFDFDVASTMDPMVAHMNISGNISADGYDEDGGFELYVVQDEDGNYTAYMRYDIEDAGDDWYKVSVPTESVGQNNAADISKTLMEGADNFKEVGEETVNGAKAVRYDAEITGEMILKVLKETKVLSQLEDLDMEFDESWLKDMKAFTISYWLDAESYLPLKLSIDMKDAVQDLLEKLTVEEDADISVDAIEITVTFDNYNKVEEIELPAAAQAAYDMTENLFGDA